MGEGLPGFMAATLALALVQLLPARLQGVPCDEFCESTERKCDQDAHLQHAIVDCNHLGHTTQVRASFVRECLVLHNTGQVGVLGGMLW